VIVVLSAEEMFAYIVDCGSKKKCLSNFCRFFYKVMSDYEMYHFIL
jgi:hypothetical protein